PLAAALAAPHGAVEGLAVRLLLGGRQRHDVGVVRVGPLLARLLRLLVGPGVGGDAVAVLLGPLRAAPVVVLVPHDEGVVERHRDVLEALLGHAGGDDLLDLPLPLGHLPLLLLGAEVTAVEVGERLAQRAVLPREVLGRGGVLATGGKGGDGQRGGGYGQGPAHLGSSDRGPLLSPARCAETIDSAPTRSRPQG